nr:YrbL family protein [Psychrobacter sp. WY6]
MVEQVSITCEHIDHKVFTDSFAESYYNLQLCKNNYANFNFTFPIETVYGFVPTDQGLGLVTERVLDPNGTATSLYEIATNHSFEDKHAIALDALFNECVEQHVVFGEVNIAGIIPNKEEAFLNSYWSMVLAKSYLYLLEP